MRISVGVLVAAAALFSSMAMAQQPVPMATTDYAVTYSLAGASRGTMIYRYSAGRGLVRMEMNADGQKADILLESKTGIGRMWSAAAPGMVMRIDGRPQARPNGRKLGQSASHAGESCEIWQVSEARVCLTGDGIPLTFESGGVTARASKIERAAQDGAQFQPPEGQEMKVPGMAIPKPF